MPCNNYRYAQPLNYQELHSRCRLAISAWDERDETILRRLHQGGYSAYVMQVPPKWGECNENNERISKKYGYSKTRFSLWMCTASASSRELQEKMTKECEWLDIILDVKRCQLISSVWADLIGCSESMHLWPSGYASP